jgi:hypothetical protein
MTASTKHQKLVLWLTSILKKRQPMLNPPDEIAHLQKLLQTHYQTLHHLEEQATKANIITSIY